MMRVLVTGAAGFVGAHLCRYLDSKKGVEVVGVSRKPLLATPGDIRFFACDLIKRDEIHRLLAKARPTHIVHLAAQSSSKRSWATPAETLMANALPAIHLFEALKELHLKARVLVAGSSEEYGDATPSLGLIQEDAPLLPVTPYGISKMTQELFAARYAADEGMFVILVRSFNLIGPGQSPDFVVSDFARQVAFIEKKRQKPEIRVGDLDTVRDFTDVRDAVKAYAALLERGRSGEVYNLATGHGRRIGEILDVLKEQTTVPFTIKKEETHLRAHDIRRMVGSPAKLSRAIGWRPLIPFEETIVDTLNDWRDRVGS